MLEFGTANGGLAFWMERQGADVVGYDLSPDQAWDIIPFANGNYAGDVEHRRNVIRQLNNAWWFSRAVHGAKAKVVYGDVYHVPASIGPVDVTTFGSILLHLRDPFLALQNGAALAREAVIVTDVMRPAGPPTLPRWLRGIRRFAPPLWRLVMPLPPPLLNAVQEFLPDGATGQPNDTWWWLHPDLIVRMLGVLGFGDVTVTYHKQQFFNESIDLFTCVGRRTRGTPIGT